MPLTRVSIYSALLSAGLFLSGIPIHAQVVITEIMYAPHTKPDTGNEWIEILNMGTNTIDIQSIRFVEAGSKHFIREENEQTDFKSGEVGIIAQSPDNFREQYPDYQGKVFKSVFSLRQKDDIGEELAIYDTQSKETTFTFTYRPDSRATGTGATLHIANHKQTSAPATPGAIAINPITVTNQTPQKQQESGRDLLQQEESTTPEEKEIKQLEIDVRNLLAATPQTERTVSQVSSLLSQTPTPDQQTATPAQLTLPDTQIPRETRATANTPSEPNNLTNRLLPWITLILLFIALELLILILYFFAPAKKE